MDSLSLPLYIYMTQNKCLYYYVEYSNPKNHNILDNSIIIILDYNFNREE